MDFGTIIISAFASLFTAISTPWLKSYFDSRNLNLSSNLKFKEIIFNQQIKYYEKFSEVSWKLILSISAYLNATGEIDVAHKIHVEYSTNFALSQIGYTKSISDKMCEFDSKLKLLMLELPKMEVPLKIETIETVLMPISTLRNEVIAAMKSHLSIEGFTHNNR